MLVPSFQAGGYNVDESGTAGQVPKDFFGGAYLNQGIVDLGQLLTLQSAHGASNAALGLAIGQVGAHELAHELGLEHTTLGGIMSQSIDPFLPSFIIYLTNEISLISASKFEA